MLLVGAGLSAAAEDPPPLSAPALVAPGAATAPEPKPTPSTGPASVGPVLVVPGVTAPARPRTSPRPAATSAATAGPEASADLPVLIGPGGPIVPSPAGPTTRPAPGSLTLESIPGEEPIVSAPAPTATSRPSPREEKPAPAPSATAPRRPPGLFGRMFLPPFLNGRAGAETRGSITVEPRSDPAADAALKRRIERQVQEALGDRVRSAEVRVVGRDISIRAKAAHFWQRRAVRRSLETLPGLTGYRATIDVDD